MTYTPGRIVLTKTDGGKVAIENDMIIWFEEDMEFKNQVIIQTATADSFPVVNTFEEIVMLLEKEN